MMSARKRKIQKSFSIWMPNKKVRVQTEPPPDVEAMVWQMILIGEGYKAVIRNGNVQVDVPQEKIRNFYRFVRRYDATL